MTRKNTMTRTLHLVDSIEYARSNCFQHQLYAALDRIPNVEHRALDSLSDVHDHDLVVCCLKQRTVHAHLDRLELLIKDTPVVIYDQDPWEAYRDGSPYKGVYRRASQRLNLRTIAVTTRLWATRLEDEGLPGSFASMWVLPEYCDTGLKYEDRPIHVGFIGSLHPHRRRLFDDMDNMGFQVNVMGGNNLPYAQYLQALGNLKIFVHSEDSPLVIDGNVENLCDALWIKDVEAAARGCFTIRNRGKDPESYYAGIETTRLYDTPDEIPGIIDAIEKMDPELRQASIDRSVEFIRRSDRWQETATRLVG